MLKYVEQEPPRELRRFLECFWCVSDGRSAPREARKPERVVPDGCPELIVHLADPFSRLVGRLFVAQPRAFLAGTLSRPWTLRPGRRVLTMGIRFRPGALTTLFEVAMDDAADREVPLLRLAGSTAARRLVGTLQEARDAGERFAAAEAWMRDRLAQAPAPATAPARTAVDLVLQARGQIRIEDLARRLEWSPRRLERSFRRDVGIRPKLFARIVRLNAVLARLGRDEREAAVDLALDAGYFDQAHLLRDFRALAGRTPRAGGAGDGEMARHFTRPERLRALFAGE